VLTVEKIKRFFRILPVVSSVAGLLLFSGAGCDFGPKADPETPASWVRVGETGLSRTDFQRAFEIYKTAYVHEDITRPAVLEEARRDFVKQMVERLTLLERARELGLSISDSELESAVKTATAGYAEGEFEETLLESAIAFDTWKSELRDRLLMERTVEADLAAQISVTAEELEAYLRSPDAPRAPDEAKRRLRRRKVEAAYGPWLDRLRDRYAVEINMPDAEPAVGSTPRESSP